MFILRNFTYHRIPAFKWLKYYPYGVKHYSSNQSIIEYKTITGKQFKSPGRGGT